MERLRSNKLNEIEKETKLGTKAAESFPCANKTFISSMEYPQSSQLLAAAKIIGHECSEKNIAFVNCKMTNGSNPEKCLAQGTEVINCGASVVQKLESSCKQSFDAYQLCMNKSRQNFEKCREVEQSLRVCWRNNYSSGAQEAKSEEGSAAHHHTN